MGGTYRIGDQASAYLGIGNILGSVGSAGASADVNTALATIGGRYGFSTLEAGPYVAARANVGWVDYQSRRALGQGLGTTQGTTKGAVMALTGEARMLAEASRRYADDERPGADALKLAPGLERYPKHEHVHPPVWGIAVRRIRSCPKDEMKDRDRMSRGRLARPQAEGVRSLR
jgi:hypothetical protein